MKRRSPFAKLAVYAVVVGAALGGGALVGAAVGPEPSPPSRESPASADTVPDGGHDAHEGSEG